jgi:hypothetical protein
MTDSKPTIGGIFNSSGKVTDSLVNIAMQSLSIKVN